MIHTKILIIGGGPAGYTAALYSARAGLDPIQILGDQPGGQLLMTTDVENYPGFPETIQGSFLMDRMDKQVKKFGVQVVGSKVTKVDFLLNPFDIFDDNNICYKADSVIIATGAKARWLGIEGEKKFRGLGVSACAVCDGFFYKNKKVIVVGGGNTAVDEALFLSKYASSVTLIHRRNTLRAEQILQERLLKNDSISVMWDTEVEKILGTEDPKKVTGVSVINNETQEKQIVEADGVFIAIGHSPETSLFRGQIDLDDEGYIITRFNSTKTSVPGIFAAGDVRDKVYKQAITAAGQGCMAAIDTEHFLYSIK
ncbi:MAG: thioredoxin-disulfide reductase [Alphaproteobacteria bacterium]